MFDILMVLGAMAAIVSALPVLGIDIRIFGRGKLTVTPEPGKSLKWRAWLALILASLTLVGVAVDVYYRAKPHIVVQTVTSDVHHNLKPISETIYDHTYQNETVEIDGKSFKHCVFENVTLMYHGTADAQIEHPVYLGLLKVETDNQAIKGYLNFTSGISSVPGMTTMGLFGKEESGNAVPLRTKKQEPPKKK